jgi:hypothetical protein
MLSEHEAMTWAVHRLHGETLVFYLEHEHILFVLGIMTRSLPKFEIVNIRGKNFLVATHSVLRLDDVDQFVVNVGTFWLEEGRSWCQFVSMHDSLLFAEVSMVSLGGLFHSGDILVHFLLGWEGDAINSLQAVVFYLTKPVRCRVLHDLECLDNFGGWDVRSGTQID